jgi:hypothetical protein
MTLAPVPATKVEVPHSSPVLGLSGIRSTERPTFWFVIRSELRISYYAALFNGHVCGFSVRKAA